MELLFVLVNATILHRLMEEKIVLDQILKYSHVMSTIVQV